MEYLLRTYVRPSAGNNSLHYKWNLYERKIYDSIEKIKERLSNLNGYGYEIFIKENDRWTLLESSL